MDADSSDVPGRRKRADAQRNVGALLEAARAVFAESGVDAPAKEITDRAGVGVGTLYRHFPRRSDLVAAVLQREIDACANAGPALADEYEPWVALTRWVDRFTEFIGTKQGLAAALHSGDPAFDALPAYFMQRVEPVVASLLDAASAAGDSRDDVTAHDLLHAVVLLCQPVPGQDLEFNRRMVGLFVEGLRQQ
ncbi:TetR/AcrR family transcriptional regulator [Mycolicibacterium baixiangningiae]|uniref:TetR/AcrR family transcriptional regulator n=1 Tax=Mycolicibacterium baixiangningiae TaxID=2761578 RepID=UPI001868D797|nr:TetR/AcrR family transcriptional regulator [Mycolicibacterium baixiangningiae]